MWHLWQFQSSTTTLARLSVSAFVCACDWLCMAERQTVRRRIYTPSQAVWTQKTLKYTYWLSHPNFYSRTVYQRQHGCHWELKTSLIFSLSEWGGAEIITLGIDARILSFSLAAYHSLMPTRSSQQQIKGTDKVKCSAQRKTAKGYARFSI